MFKKRLGFAILPLLLVFSSCYADSAVQQVIPANNTIPQASLQFATAQVADAVAEKLLQDMESIVLQDNDSAKTQVGFHWHNNIP